MKKMTLILAVVLSLAIAATAPAAKQEDWSGLSLKAIELLALGKNDGANDAGKQAVEAAEKSLGPENPIVAALYYQLAELKRSQANNAEAEQLYKKSLALLEKAGDNDRALAVYPLVGLGNVQLERGNAAEAADLYEKALRSLEEHGSVSTTKLKCQVASRLEKLYKVLGKKSLADSMRDKRASLSKNMVVSKGAGEIIGSIFNGIGSIISQVTPEGFPPIGIELGMGSGDDMGSGEDMDPGMGEGDDSSMDEDMTADPYDPDFDISGVPGASSGEVYVPRPPKPKFGVTKFDQALQRKLANRTIKRTKPQKGKRANDQIALGNKFRNLGKSKSQFSAVKPLDQDRSLDQARETANPIYELTKQLKSDIETGNSSKLVEHFGNLSNVKLGQVFEGLAERDVDRLMAILPDVDRNKLLRRLHGGNLDNALASILHPENAVIPDFPKEVFSGLDDSTLRKVAPYLRPSDFAVLGSQGFGVDRFLKAGVSRQTLLDLGVEIPLEPRKRGQNASNELIIMPVDQPPGRDETRQGTGTEANTTEIARQQTAQASKKDLSPVEAWNKVKNSPEYKEFVNVMSQLGRDKPGRFAN